MRRMLILLALASLLPAALPQAKAVQAQSPLTLTVSTDRAAYATATPVTVTLTLTNPTNAPVTLTFPSGQIYDFAVTSPAGVAEAWRWSRGRAFAQAVTTRTITPGETQTFSERWNQRTATGEQVPTGVYAVTGGLATQPPISTARAQFVIGEPQPLPGPGCVDVALTFPDGTPVDLMLTTFDPRSAVSGLWKREGDHWLGWSPLSGAPNDLRTVNFRDQVRICLAAGAVWLRPL